MTLQDGISLGSLNIFSIPPHKPEPKEFRSPPPGCVSQYTIRTTKFRSPAVYTKVCLKVKNKKMTQGNF